MLLIDDILFFPVISIHWIFREIYQAAQQELENEGETIMADLRELYMTLETGKITESEFDNREKLLLDRLDKLEKG